MSYATSALLAAAHGTADAHRGEVKLGASKVKVPFRGWPFFDFSAVGEMHGSRLCLCLAPDLDHGRCQSGASVKTRQSVSEVGKSVQKDIEENRERAGFPVTLY